MQLLETIRFEFGNFSNIELHQNRMNKSRKELFKITNAINLYETLFTYAAELPDNLLLKCRIVYMHKIEKVDFIPYVVPTITSLKFVECNEIVYNYKYINRTKINELRAKKCAADDIIIVKNGLITDSSFSNLLFFNGTHWLTPANPLLLGTQRWLLLKNERIVTADIRPGDIHNFTKIRLINAMLRFEDEVDIAIENVY